ncbi:MAG: hypothetical protein ACT4TC_21960 [Myxococcaceae bacterium]
MAPREKRRLVVVRHRGEGEPGDAGSLCQKIRAAVSATAARIVLLHDGTSMSIASLGYAKAFQDLDSELGPRLDQVVCVAPAPLPRMLAQTIKLASSRDWRIFKSALEAIAFLREGEFDITVEKLQSIEDVRLL